MPPPHSLNRPRPLRDTLADPGLVVPVLMFAAVAALAATVADTRDAITVLYGVPVALIAIRYGMRGGLAAALTAIALVLVESALGWVDLRLLGLIARGSTLLLIGGLVGRYVDRLRSARARQQELFTRSPSVLLETDAAGRVVSVNPAAQRLLRCAGDDLIGVPLEQIVPGAMTLGEEPRELTARRTDGSTVAVECSLAPFATGAGLHVRVTLTDISDRRRAEAAQAALAESEERFRAAFESAPAGMALLAPDERMLWVNRALARLTGRPEDALQGTPLTSVCHLDDRGVVEATLAAAERHPAPQGVEIRLAAAAGGTSWVALGVSLVQRPNGQPQHLIAHLQDVTERKQFESRLRELADHDPLTGLLNRRRFAEDLTRHLAHAARYGHDGALLLLDLDHFKYVNDTLGHAAGDDLIRSVGAVLRDRLRATDVLARLGGDEFAILLPEVEPGDAERVAAALVHAIEMHGLDGPSDATARVTTSIGVVDLRGHAGSTAEDALVDADLAMYEAKSLGRNRMVFYDAAAAQRARTAARFTWATRIQRALDEGSFVLERQPILDLATDEVALYELLVRMVDDGELVAPDRFLHIAQRYGLMRRLDRWVVGEAVRLLATDGAGAGPPAAINLSSDSLNDLDLLDELEQRMKDAQVPPVRLVFEVTETAAIARMDEAREFVARLRELGCRFALDDFGAGFASFYYLKHLPFDYLKIDGEFVRAMAENPTDQIIVRSIVQTARGLGKRTVAECVGDDATVTLLRDVGVDYAQGFHVGRPRPVSEWGARELPHR